MMMRIFGRTVAAEWVKLCGLPPVVAAMLGTVAAAVVLAAAAAIGADRGDAVEATAWTIPLVQAGPILIGVLTVGSEYGGRQICATVISMPHRPLLLAAKTVAYLIAAGTTCTAAVGAGLAAARIALTMQDEDVSGEAMDGWLVGKAVAYLVMLGVLALALAVLFRALIAPAATMLAAVLVVSPLLAGITQHARWLPDRAGSLLYRPDTDSVLTPGTGTLVLLAWITVTASAAVAAFEARDA